MRRGEIWQVDVDPARGGKANKHRPAVIVSNDRANATAARLGRGVITVAPVTSNIATIHPFQVLLAAATTGLAVARLGRALPGAMFVSARTGEGVDALRRRMAELAAPTDTAIDVVIPYDRGDLVLRVHTDGRVQQTEHHSDGARIKARVPVARAASPRKFSADGPS